MKARGRFNQLPVNKRLEIVCDIFAAIRNKKSGDEQVFPAAFGIGLFWKVVDRDIDSMQIANLAVDYGRAMLN